MEWSSQLTKNPLQHISLKTELINSSSTKPSHLTLEFADDRAVEGGGKECTADAGADAKMALIRSISCMRRRLGQNTEKENRERGDEDRARERGRRPGWKKLRRREKTQRMRDGSFGRRKSRRKKRLGD